ncbi:MAG: RsmD family RNA methyltransferase [Candidatus Zixiibacteriota bacterium]
MRKHEKRKKGQALPRQFEFTVITGTLKGRTIVSPDLGVTRPPLSRLRKAIFDFLMPYLEDAHYLDLYSGTGSYLFEAVSRGVGSATGIEIEQALVQSINDQASRFGVDARLVCLCEDVFVAIPRLTAQGKQYDIIMIAPPQYQGLIDKTLNALRQSPLLSPNGIILCQHDKSETDKIDFSAWSILQQRAYGNTVFTVLAAR